MGTNRMEYRLQEIEGKMIKEVEDFLEWGGIETPARMLFDLFSDMRSNEFESKHIYDVAWESLRTLLTLTKLYQLNEQRQAAKKIIKNNKLLTN